MTTHAFGRAAHGGARAATALSSHWTWLAVGFGVAFATPFLLADLLGLHRDLFYGIYALAVAGLFAAPLSENPSVRTGPWTRRARAWVGPERRLAADGRSGARALKRRRGRSQPASAPA